MSKVIQAINVMISNPERITQVLPNASSGAEYFFSFDRKHKWSISLNNQTNDYTLFYYPGPQILEYLAEFEDWPTNQIPMVTYSTETFSTIEARESFKELYNLVKEKIYNVDKVFDEIIKSDTDVHQ